MSCGKENQKMCRHSVEEEKPLSLAVIECIADADGTDPDTHPPLYEVIDPEALNNLFRDQTTGEVTFTYLDYKITVNHNTVTAQPTADQPVGAD
ncbi:HalOD1 output domain-containing protein [Halorussus salinisoli]|uniref:HalOD1 output domain-containing protein n=1 Tax=Halorussus salinisoli TaxID=2558242 RepID=UPI002A919B88|nr:HalOD1 output domain-containing protein [Halorussus salinisoli]